MVHKEDTACNTDELKEDSAPEIANMSAEVCPNSIESTKWINCSHNWNSNEKHSKQNDI